MTNKVLVLTENFPPISGGSGRWFWELYSRLPKDEYLIVANLTDEALLFDQSHGLHIIRMPLYASEWGFKSVKGLKFYWRSVWALKKIIKQHHITHIHCGRVIHEGVTAWLLKLLTGIPYLCYVHGEDVETAATSGEHNLMVKQVCKYADQIICNSHNSAKIVQRLGYADDNKIQVLHPGVDSSKFIPVAPDPVFRQNVGWQDRKVIITVGRLQERKGQDMMIRAVAELVEHMPDILYVIIGRGECREILEELTKSLSLQRHVIFMDEIDDEQMIQCYQQCDLFILPNRTINNDIEGFGMVLVEAQSCGKVVIAGDSGGTRETMKLNDSGYIIDCTNPVLIAETVKSLLDNPDKLKAMGVTARQHIVDTLDWQAHVNRATKIFHL
jgi:phosphatidylinositol alpha-1,6-mannosyltransferase